MRKRPQSITRAGGESTRPKWAHESTTAMEVASVLHRNAGADDIPAPRQVPASQIATSTPGRTCKRPSSWLPAAGASAGPYGFGPWSIGSSPTDYGPTTGLFKGALPNSQLQRPPPFILNPSVHLPSRPLKLLAHLLHTLP